MCEVPDPIQFLKDVDSVLKVGGKIVFLEHIRGPDGSFLARLQDFISGWWRTVTDGCNCNRNTVKTIRSMSNWKVDSWDLDISSSSPHVRLFACGIATKLA